MNKYLMMSAAALLGSAAPGFAAHPSGTHAIHFGTSNGGTYCDGMSFYKSPYSGAPIELGTHLLSGCGETDTEVAGKGSKTQFTLVEGWISNTTFVYDISKPIKNGGAWVVYICPNGSTCFFGNSGTYALGYQPAKGIRQSTTARVGAMIAERKAARR